MGTSNDKDDPAEGKSTGTNSPQDNKVPPSTTGQTPKTSRVDSTRGQTKDNEHATHSTTNKSNNNHKSPAITDHDKASQADSQQPSSTHSTNLPKLSIKDNHASASALTKGKHTETKSPQDEIVPPSTTIQTPKTSRVDSTRGQTKDNEHATHPTTNKSNNNHKSLAITDHGKASQAVSNRQTRHTKDSQQPSSTHSTNLRKSSKKYNSASTPTEAKAAKHTETNSSHEDQDGSDVSPSTISQTENSPKGHSTIQRKPSKNSSPKASVKKEQKKKRDVIKDKNQSTRLFAPADYANFYHKDIEVDQKENKKKKRKKGQYVVPSDAPKELIDNIKKTRKHHKMKHRRRPRKRRRRRKKNSTTESTSSQFCCSRFCVMM